MPNRPDQPIDFFVSYSPADERWATWLAWEFEAAGFRTLLQAWDFVPGTNFIDFMDRGVRDAAVVVAVLSERYLHSTYGRLEWQAALRADPDGRGNKLVTVRIEDCQLEGLLATITYIDLVGVTDSATARERVMSRLRQAMSGRARPAARPASPFDAPDALPAAADPAAALRRPRSRRTPINPPPFPPARPAPGSRTALTVLQVAGPRFGRGLISPGAPATPGEMQEHIMGDLTLMMNRGAPRPDLIVVGGNLTESGGARQFEDALSFLTGLRVLVGLEPNRLIVVPGPHDVTAAASRAYFATCEADDIEPQPPYWPKWRHYARLFGELYQGLEEPVFDAEQPWTLFAVPELQVVVAGLNSTIGDSHREDDHYGWLSEAQATWFAQWLRSYEQSDWFRLGVMAHAPGPRTDYGDLVIEDALRDRTTFNRLVAPMLNLVVSGAPPAHDTRDSAALVVPTPRDGSAQLLALTPAGMTRWVLGRDDKLEAGERTEHTWHRAKATFGTGVQLVVEAAAHDAAPPEPRDEGPANQLLDRLSEVSEARHDKVLVRRHNTHLLVTYREDGVVRQERVGAFVGTPTADDIDTFVQTVHATDPDIASSLVYDGGQRVPRALVQETLRRGVSVVSLVEFQGLLDLRDYVEAQAARLQTDRRYPPELYVPQRYRHLVGGDRGVREDAVDELVSLLSTNEGRFVLLLGDFGRGKTFALRELCRRLTTTRRDLIPILVELRALDKAHSVEGLVAAHLANHGEDLIDLKAFRFMLRHGRVVLLFDGFDELVSRVTYDRAADHLETLLHAADGNAKIVVASRTQHFRTTSQVLTALGERVGLLPHRRVLELEEFSSGQIRAYLRHRYQGDETAADNRFELMRGVEDLIGLSRNPRMLGFVANLDDARLESVARTGHTISAAGLYQEILDSWLAFEVDRVQGMPGAPVSLSRDQLWQAVTTLAFRLWENNESVLRLAEITEVSTAIGGLTETHLSPDQAAHAVGAGSLLIRTEEGLFGFIHSSVMEWLVAHEIARELSRGEDPVALHQRPLSQLTVDFLIDLADTARCEAWTARTLSSAAGVETDDIGRANALKLTTRLRLPAQADLRGAILKGEDLSHRELSNVDLTGADLTATRLVETNLRGATLRDACLDSAWLDRTRLDGADLSGADLSSARLLRANLSGARAAGATWRRAALIDSTLDGPLREQAERAGAAIAPGHPVTPALAPQAIGVSYGFEVGRLPSPIAFGPGAATLAIGSDDGGVLIVDAASALPVRTLQGHKGRVYAVAYDRVAGRLITGASDATMRLWDADHGEEIRTIPGFREWTWPLIVDETRGLFAVGDSSETIRVYSTVTGQLRHEFTGAVAPVWSGGFDPARDAFAAADSFGTVRVWDLITGELRYSFRADDVVYRLVYSPDGSVLATAGHDGSVHLRDPGTGEVRHRLRGHEAHVYALDFHPDAGILATGDTRGALRLWEQGSGAAVRMLGRHRGAVYSVRFSPDGGTLASADSDGLVRLWDMNSHQLRHELTGHRGSVWPVEFRPGTTELVTSSNDGSTRVWDVNTGEVRNTLRGHGRRITSVSFSAVTGALATCGNDGSVRLWDPRTGRCVRELVSEADRLISAVFAPRVPLIATASGDGGVHLWNAETGTDERELNVETVDVWAEAFSPDAEVLATANDDDTVALWYRTTGRRITTLGEHRGRVRSVNFSPDGELLATGCDDGRVRVFETSGGRLRRTLEFHTDRVYSVEFSPDGRHLASAGNDGVAALWDPATGERLQTFHETAGRLWSAAFSPDGTVLATGGDDLAVRLWDVRTGRLRRALSAHTRRIWQVAFNAEGDLLASAGDDGTVRLWKVDDPDRAELHLTLLSLRGGWAALSPDGRYKLDGEAAGQFWHVIGTSRFELGELDAYLPEVRRLAVEQPF
jgi:WD40 repeat protein